MSFNWDDDDRPHWTQETVSERTHKYQKKLTSGRWVGDYTVECGRHRDGTKAFRQWRSASMDDLLIAEGNGEKVDKENFRIMSIGDDRTQLWLYRAQEIEEDDKARTVWLCEGEKDAERLFKEGLLATTCPGGARKWSDSYSEQLKDRKVVLLPDNDESGRQHMAQAAASLHGIAAEVRVIELWEAWPEMPASGDVSDWLERGDGTRAELETLAEKAGVPDWVTQQARHVITIAAGKLDTLATEAENALLAFGAPLYVHGATISKPVVDEVEAARGRTTKVARLTTATADVLRDYMSRAARWRKWDKRMSRHVPSDPPRDIAMTLLSRDGEWRLPKILGLITTPTIRPDGSLLTEEGYDPATRLLLLDPPIMPPIPDCPTEAQAKEALNLLDELLEEFPFVDGASRAVALSALITPVCLGALPVSPMHMANAPMPGTGKSYLFDIVSAIAQGRICPVISAGGSVEETEKRLGAALLKGQSLISIDNLNGELAGDALCQLIERPVVEVRELGMSRNVTIEARRFLCANGNNIRVVADVGRRVVMASLDANMERPELRPFKGKPFDEVMERRGEYIAAALTVVRAYIVADFPNPRPPLASFEDWSRIVRSALTWLGKDDPVDTMEAARDDDPELEKLRTVVAAWRAVVGDQPVLTKELVEYATATESGIPSEFRWRHPQLHDALQEATGSWRELDAHKLGMWLRRQRGRIVDGFRIDSETDRVTKQPRWRVKSVTKQESQENTRACASPVEERL